LGIETFLGSSGDLVGPRMPGQLQAFQETCPTYPPNSGRSLRILDGCWNERAHWQDADRTVRLASRDLLDALNRALVVLDTNADESGPSREEAIKQAPLPSPTRVSHERPEIHRDRRQALSLARHRENATGAMPSHRRSRAGAAAAVSIARGFSSASRTLCRRPVISNRRSFRSSPPRPEGKPRRDGSPSIPITRITINQQETCSPPSSTADKHRSGRRQPKICDRTSGRGPCDREWIVPGDYGVMIGRISPPISFSPALLQHVPKDAVGLPDRPSDHEDLPRNRLKLIPRSGDKSGDKPVITRA
jgi:hypothetical protein